MSWSEAVEGYDFRDWVAMVSLNAFEFDVLDDFIQVADDKALTFLRSHWDCGYDKVLRGYIPPARPTQKRLMLEVL